jgi:predicted Zn-dependent protease
LKALLFLCGLTALGCATVNKEEVGPRPNLSPLEKKLGENPNDAAVNLQLGADAEAGGDLLRAEQYYLRAEALGMKSELITPRLLRVLVDAHRYDEALQRCRRRLAKKPDDRATRYVQAALLMALDKPKEAEYELRTLVRTAPNDAQAYLALAKVYRDGYNDRGRAHELFRRYLELDPNGQEAPAVRFELAGESPAEAQP